MFDHVKFGVSDYAASTAFFLKALEPLGVLLSRRGRRRTVSSLAQRGRLHWRGRKGSVCESQQIRRQQHESGYDSRT